MTVPALAERTRPRWRRLPLVASGIVSLLAGLWTGLGRVGWSVALPRPSMTAAHGPLMVAGFLGTVIGIERAVALERREGAPRPGTRRDAHGRSTSGSREGSRSTGLIGALGAHWAWFAPILTALGALALFAGLPGPWLAVIAAGSLAFAAASIRVVLVQPALHTEVLAAGAIAWVAGNALWTAGWPIFRVVPWWMTFLVLTIAAERLELGRLRRPTRAQRPLFIAAVVALLGTTAWTTSDISASRAFGLTLVAIALWLAVYDIARQTVRRRGLPRFVAVCLLSGYVWLALGGALLAVGTPLVPGLGYDATLHAVFVGFVMSMIFGHAPIIFPAILNVPITYRPAFYTHLVILDLSLAARLAGDLTVNQPLRAWGALGNAVAIVLFIALTVRSVLSKLRASSSVRAKPPRQVGMHRGPDADFDSTGGSC